MTDLSYYLGFRDQTDLLVVCLFYSVFVVAFVLFASARYYNND